MDIKTDVPGIYRSEKGYLINKDNDGLAAYKKQKMTAQKMIKIERELDEIKCDITEIKEMIRGLVK